MEGSGSEEPKIKEEEAANLETAIEATEQHQDSFDILRMVVDQNGVYNLIGFPDNVFEQQQDPDDIFNQQQLFSNDVFDHQQGQVLIDDIKYQGNEDFKHLEGLFSTDQPLPDVSQLIRSPSSFHASNSTIVPPVSEVVDSPPSSSKSTKPGKKNKSKKQKKSDLKGVKEGKIIKAKDKKKKNKKKKKNGDKEKEEPKKKKKNGDKEKEEPKKKRGPDPGKGGRPTLEQQLASLQLKVNKLKQAKTPIMIDAGSVKQEVDAPKVEAEDPLALAVEPMEEDKIKSEVTEETENDTEMQKQMEEDKIKSKVTEEVENDTEMQMEKEDGIKSEVVENDADVQKQEETENDLYDIFDTEDPETVQLLIICPAFTKENKEKMEEAFGIRFPLDRIAKSAIETLFIVKTIIKEFKNQAIKQINKSKFEEKNVRAMVYENRGMFKLPLITIFTDKGKKYKK